MTAQAGTLRSIVGSFRLSETAQTSTPSPFAGAGLGAPVAPMAPAAPATPMAPVATMAPPGNATPTNLSAPPTGAHAIPFDDDDDDVLNSF